MTLFCPVCGARPDSWGPISATGARESLFCPVCNATSRQRAVARAVVEVMEPGAFPGGAIATLDRIRGAVHSVYQVGWDQISPYYRGIFCHVVSEREPRPGCIVQDVEHLTFGSATFDLFLCSDVLEHVRLYRRALAEFWRVLTPGGCLILTVPMHERPTHEDYCHIRDYSDPSLDEWQKDAPVHSDPVSDDGCRMYRVYGWKQLRLEIQANGFDPRLRPADVPEYGIVNCPVAIARKESR